MALAIGMFVYCLVTSQLTVSVVLNAIVAIGLSINQFYISRDTARFIEKSDSTDNPVSNSDNHAPPHESS